MQAVLAARVSRREFYLAKAIAGLGYMAVLSLVTVGVAGLAAVVLLGLLVLVLSGNAGQAIGATIGLLVMLETVKSALKVKEYVFTTHIGGAWYVFQQVWQGLDYLWRPEIWWMIGVPLA